MGSPRERSIFGVGTSIASMAVVVASLWSVLVGPVDQPVLLLACGVAYLVALFGVLWVVRVGRGQHALVAALFVLAGANVWVSRGATILLLMPLVSLVVLWFAFRSAVALTVLLGIFVALVRSYRGGVAVLGTAADFGSAAVFTVIFSRLLQREHAAALRIERLAADVEARNQQLSAYAARIEELATVQERNRIAREIHDSLGHYLTSAHVQLEVARTALAKGGTNAETHLARAQELLHGGLGEVRRSVVTLRSPTADRPLGAALRDLVDETRAAGIDAKIHVRGTVRPLGPSVEFALYRAAQEGLTNVRRHAAARSAELQLVYENDHVELRIDDDGRGASRTDEGFGLVGVRERIAHVGGTVDVETAASGGFSLRVRVPD